MQNPRKKTARIWIGNLLQPKQYTPIHIVRFRDSADELSAALSESRHARPPYKLIEAVYGPSVFGSYGEYGIMPNFFFSMAALEVGRQKFRKETKAHPLTHYHDGSLRRYLNENPKPRNPKPLLPHDKKTIWTFFGHDDDEDNSESLEESYEMLRVIAHVHGPEVAANVFRATNAYKFLFDKVSLIEGVAGFCPQEIREAINDALSPSAAAGGWAIEKRNQLATKIDELIEVYGNQAPIVYVKQRLGSMDTTTQDPLMIGNRILNLEKLKARVRSKLEKLIEDTGDPKGDVSDRHEDMSLLDLLQMRAYTRLYIRSMADYACESANRSERYWYRGVVAKSMDKIDDLRILPIGDAQRLSTAFGKANGVYMEVYKLSRRLPGVTGVQILHDWIEYFHGMMEGSQRRVQGQLSVGHDIPSGVDTQYGRALREIRLIGENIARLPRISQRR